MRNSIFFVRRTCGGLPFGRFGPRTPSFVCWHNFFFGGGTTGTSIRPLLFEICMNIDFDCGMQLVFVQMFKCILTFQMIHLITTFILQMY